jgi:Tetratricopeptide repeat
VLPGSLAAPSFFVVGIRCDAAVGSFGPVTERWARPVWRRDSLTPPGPPCKLEQCGGRRGNPSLAKRTASSAAIRDWPGLRAPRGQAISAQAIVSPVKSRLAAPGMLLLSVAVITAAAVSARAASPQPNLSGPVRIQASPQLFATMCALYAAGFDSDASTAGVDPDLVRLRTHMLELHGPAATALRAYYRSHALADPSATMSPYVTFALVAGPPPKFALALSRESLPPDVLELDGFSAVLADFYQEAQIGRLWNQFQPSYQRQLLRLREPLSRVVLTETAYLRELVPPGPRTFTVYAEPLVDARTNFRNVGDRYAVVVNPDVDSFDEIRHAFLHFLLDPLPIRYGKELAADAGLLQIAARAPRLPEQFRDHFTAFFTECLVRAVELRLRHLPPAQLAGEVDSAEADGYVLERPLMGALAKFEVASPSMTYYFPDLARSIDVAAETRRLQTVSFAPASHLQQSSSVEAAPLLPSPGLSPDLAALLADGERSIAAQDAPAATAAFQRVLEKAPGQQRALYGLAVASVLEGKATRARQLFEQVIAASSSPGATAARPDPVALAWSHVYLGRMHDLEGSRDAALAEYRAALAVPNAPEAARVAAQRGIAQGYRPAAGKPSPG